MGTEFIHIMLNLFPAEEHAKVPSALSFKVALKGGDLIE